MSPHTALFCFTPRWARPGALASPAAKALNLCSPCPLWSSQTSIWRKLWSCFTHTLSEGRSGLRMWRFLNTRPINSLFQEYIKSESTTRAFHPPEGEPSIEVGVHDVSHEPDFHFAANFFLFFSFSNTCLTHCENQQGQRRRVQRLLCWKSININN